MAQETKSFNIAFDRDFTIMIDFPKVGITRNNAKPLYAVEELANWMSKHKPAIQLMGEFNVEEDPDAGYYNDLAQTWESEYFAVPDTTARIEYADVTTFLRGIITDEAEGFDALLASAGMMGGTIERYDIEWDENRMGNMVASITFREIACKGN